MNRIWCRVLVWCRCRGWRSVLGYMQLLSSGSGLGLVLGVVGLTPG
jgi:hypothetical protein